MGEHPIENLMNTAMNSIKDMIDVNTIIGEPIQASNNTVIIFANYSFTIFNLTSTISDGLDFFWYVTHTESNLPL